MTSSLTPARTPYARSQPSTIADVNVELKKIAAQQQGAFTPLVLVSARSPYTVQSTDWFILCDCSSGPIAVIFPAAARVDGMNVRVVKTDATANQVTLRATISGVTNPVLGAQYAELTIDAGNGVFYAQGAAGSGGLVGSRYRITTLGKFRVTTSGASRITTAGA